LPVVVLNTVCLDPKDIGKFGIVQVWSLALLRVAQGKARIRIQLSAAREMEHLEKAVAAFTNVSMELG